MTRLLLSALMAFSVPAPALAQASASERAINAAVDATRAKVIAWRRDIHEHPELSNAEFRTAKMVADHLRALGLVVHTNVSGTGVIGVLHGGRPGGVVALRADMDALPVTEKTDLPFASKAIVDIGGVPTPVMHACGHDAHTAILMGAAEVLSGMRGRIAGTVVFIFQPAEEVSATGQSGGAPAMAKDPEILRLRPQAVFGLHVLPGRTGAISWRSGPFMAAADGWRLEVTGRQAHGAMPWGGVDAASVAAGVVEAFNQITAHQLDVARSPTVLTVGEIHLGARPNIIPGDFVMAGTLRSFDPATRTLALAKIDTALKALGAQYGATLAMKWLGGVGAVINDADLATRMAPTLARAAPAGAHGDAGYMMGSEDFSAYAALAPTLFVHLGVGEGPPNHSPQFRIDEAALAVGVRAHVMVALDFLDHVTGRPNQALRAISRDKSGRGRAGAAMAEASAGP